VSGIRMHWLLRDGHTVEVLEQAGFQYDSTFGYNDTVGYRAGTGQVFRPLNASRLLEVPLHIQDGAMFYPQKSDLTEAEADTLCRRLMDHSVSSGGVLTVLWHDRSHAAERFWGEFYERLVARLRAMTPWFCSCQQAAQWFAQRRQVRFQGSPNDPGFLEYSGEAIEPPLVVRVHAGRTEADIADVPWDGLKPWTATEAHSHV
jgi:hypothetical protein